MRKSFVGLTQGQPNGPRSRSGQVPTPNDLFEDFEATEILQREIDRSARRRSREYIGIFTDNPSFEPKITVRDSSRFSITANDPLRAVNRDSVKGKPTSSPYKISVMKNRTPERLSRERGSEMTSPSPYLKTSPMKSHGMSTSGPVMTSPCIGRNALTTEGEGYSNHPIIQLTSSQTYNSRSIPTEEGEELHIRRPQNVKNLYEGQHSSTTLKGSQTLPSERRASNQFDDRCTFAGTTPDVNSILQDLIAFNNKLPPGRRLEKVSRSPSPYERFSFSAKETQVSEFRVNAPMNSARTSQIYTQRTLTESSVYPASMTQSTPRTHLNTESGNQTFNKKKKRFDKIQPPKVNMEVHNKNNGDDSVELTKEDLRAERRFSSSRIFGRPSRRSSVETLEPEPEQYDIKGQFLVMNKQLKSTWDKENGSLTERPGYNQKHYKIRGRPPLHSSNHKQSNIGNLLDVSQLELEDETDRKGSLPGCIQNSLSKPHMPKTGKSKF